jgi:MYXO-CTERM domain-containing protein
LRNLPRLVLVALFLSVTASSADVIRVARPRAAGQSAAEARPGEAGGLLRNSGTAPECRNNKGNPIPCTLNVKYFGGHVISNVKVYAVFWDATVSSEIVLGIGDFYRALTNSEYLDWLTEYSTTGTVEAGSLVGHPGTGQVIGRGSFAGNYTLPSLSKPYPACAAPNAALTCITDADITSELEYQVGAGRLPAHDANTFYVLHLPPSLKVNDATGAGVSCKDFCAYHATYLSGANSVFYAVVPDLSSNGCETGCGTGTVFQNTCSAASHEVAEALTDAEVGLATSADVPLAWYDFETVSQGEIGDMCNQRTDTVGTDGLTGCVAGAAGCYTLQQVFSHAVWNADPAGHPNTLACVSARYQESGDFSLAFAPNTLTLAPGATAPALPVLTTLTAAADGGAPLPLTLSVTDVPAGVHASLDTASLNVGDAAQLMVSADAAAAPLKDGVLVVRATSNTTPSVVHSAAVLVQVVIPPNDWSLSLSPPSAALAPGTSQAYTVSGRVTAGKAEAVSLASTVAGLPAGVTSNLSTTTLTPGASTAVLTLSASASAPPAALTAFTLTATSASQAGGHTATAQLQLDGLPRVSISAPSAGATVAGVVLLQVSATAGANTSLASLTISVDSAALSTGTASSVSWDSRSVSNGAHALTVRVLDADGGSATASLSVTVANVVNDFGLALSPSSVALAGGSSVDVSVSTSLVSGSAEPVSLAVSGLPPGVQGQFVPPQVAAGGSSTLTLSAPSGTAPAPATTLTVLGTSPSQPGGHTATASVSVSAPSSRGCSSTGGGEARWPLLLLALLPFHRRGRAA